MSGTGTQDNPLPLRGDAPGTCQVHRTLSRSHSLPAMGMPVPLLPRAHPSLRDGRACSAASPRPGRS